MNLDLLSDLTKLVITLTSSAFIMHATLSLDTSETDASLAVLFILCRKMSCSGLGTSCSSKTDIL
jgi:hypothetical protein